MLQKSEERKNIVRVFRCALIFTVLGIFAYGLLMIGAQFLTTTVLRTPQKYLRTLCISAYYHYFFHNGSYTGLFQGLGTMMPTAFRKLNKL